MALLLKYWERCAALFLAALAVSALALDRLGRDRSCAIALDAHAVRALCLSESVSPSEFWERAAAMGVAAALIRPDALERYFRMGEVLRFTPAEIEKLRATKIAAAAAPLSSGALWVRHDELVVRIKAAAAAEGIPLSYRRWEGMHIVELPKSREAESFGVGYDPDLRRQPVVKGLVPVYYVRDAAGLALARQAEAPAVYLLAPGFTRMGAAAADASGLLEKRGGWVAFSDSGAGGMLGRLAPGARAEFIRESGAPLARVMTAGEVPVDAGSAEFIRRAVWGGNRIVVAALDPDRGVEWNLEQVRGVLRRLRGEGYSAELPAGLRDIPRASAPGWPLRFLMGLLLTVLGPILALRAGALAVRGLQAAKPLPIASPFLEIGAGILAAGGVSAAAGAGAYAALAVGAWRLDATALRWGPWAAALTMLLAFLALFAPDSDELSLLLRKPMAAASSLRVAVPVAASMLLVFPPDWLIELGPRAWLEWIASGRDSWWWVADRWREWLIGYPCLFVGLFIFHQRLDAPGSPALEPSGHDPRAWLMLAMFAPVGLADVLAGARVPFELALGHTLRGGAAGLAAGLILVAGLHARISSENRGPSP